MSDVVVVGGGLAGLLAADHCLRAGADVTVVAFGLGGLPLSTGCVDVLGYAPDRVREPFAELGGFAADHPGHPYAVLGADAVRAGIDAYAAYVGTGLVAGRGERNVTLPTAVGALRPTYLAEPSLLAATVEPDASGESIVVVGLDELKDFQTELIAGNLARQLPNCQVRATSLSFPIRGGEVDSTALSFARALERPETVDRFAEALSMQVGNGERVLLPAVLGLTGDLAGDLAVRLGTSVGEIPLPPPSVPGLRLHNFATRDLQRRRARWISGSRVVGLTTEGDRVTAVHVATTGHVTEIDCGAVIYAPGGFESGALQLDSHGEVKETWLGLPVRVPDGDLVTADRKAEQPLFASGLAIDERCCVLDALDRPVYTNLFAAGGVVAGAQRWRELSGEGIAAATAVRAAESSGGIR